MMMIRRIGSPSAGRLQRHLSGLLQSAAGSRQYRTNHEGRHLTLQVRALSTEQIEEIQVNGFLVVEDVLSAEEVATLAERADLIAAGELEHIPQTSLQMEPVFRNGEKPVEDKVLTTRKLYDIAVYDPVMWQHVVHPRIVDMIAALLGTQDLKMYGDQLFMKAAETGTAQQWHQDSSSWHDIFPMDLVTAWTVIDQATLDNGCLNFAPGTQRWGRMRSGQLGPFVEDVTAGKWPIVPVPLRPGSISFHHSLTLHCSGANQSTTRRRVYGG